MIGAIINAFVGFLSFILGLLPSLSFPDVTAQLTAIGSDHIWHYLAWANYYTPVDLALILFSLRFAFGVAMFGFEFLTWGLTKLHILGGSS